MVFYAFMYENRSRTQSKNILYYAFPEVYIDLVRDYGDGTWTPTSSESASNLTSFVFLQKPLVPASVDEITMEHIGSKLEKVRTR